MQRSTLTVMGLVLAVALSACNNAKSPDAVANDVAAAQQKADAKVANARDDAAKDSNKAEAKVDDKSAEMNNVDAKGAYDVSLVKAEGDHKVATEKCMAMAGDSQKACKDKADATYDLAKANAKANLAAQKQ